MKILGSVLLAIIGLTFLFVGLVAILDPVGTQQANDSNPFASPPTAYQSYIIAFTGLSSIALALWLGFKRGK